MKKSLKALLLNEETQGLWEYVNTKCRVKIVPYNDYSVNIIKRKFRSNLATIKYDYLNPRPDYFAHELLHIKINCQGYIISKLIDELFWDFPIVSQTWDRQFRNLIGNIIEHEKTFDEYVKLGFREDEFVGDYYEKKCSLQEIDIEMRMSLHPSIDSLKYITAKFFLIKGTINPSFDYDEELNLFIKLAPNLYKTLDAFWNSISQMKEPFNKQNQELIVLDLFNSLEEIYSGV